MIVPDNPYPNVKDITTQTARRAWFLGYQQARAVLAAEMNAQVEVNADNANAMGYALDVLDGKG